MGFTPLASNAPTKRGFTPGFTPLNQDDEQPGAFAPAVETINDIGRVYPVVETAGNLATQAVTMPVAGIAGLGAIATNAVGLTDTDPADVVHKVAGALTYQPQTDAGKRLTNAAMYPFEKLQEAGQYAGDKTLDSTGSPAMATVADTAVNALPLALPVKIAKPKGTLERAADKANLLPIESRFADQQGGPLLTDVKVSTKVSTENPPAGFTPIDEAAMRNAPAVPSISANLMDLPAEAEVANAKKAMDAAGVTGTDRTSTIAAVRRGELTADEVAESHPVDSQPTVVPENARQTANITSPVDVGAHEAATSPLNGTPEPTPDQKAAGNFKVGRTTIAGMNISIENPHGSIRRSHPNAPKQWQTDMKDHYGYFSGVPARALDKDHVDVFVKPGTPEDFSGDVYVIDQKHTAALVSADTVSTGVSTETNTGKFDEPKVMLGYGSEQEASNAYHANYEQGWRGMMGITRVPLDKFKAMLQDKNAFKRPQNAVKEMVTEHQNMPLNVKPEQRTKGFRPIDATELPRTRGFTPIENTLPDAPVDSRGAWAPGANHVGFVDNATTAGKLAEKPIRREDVLAPLMKGLGVRLYEGRVNGKRLGFYLPKLEAVRIKHKSDLEVAAHEIAHALDDRIPAIREAWLKGDKAKIHAEELRGVSYDKTKLFEGFAEFTRLYMTQPEKAKAAAPNFYRWFDDFTRAHKYGPTIRKAQESMTAWFNQDALVRAQSKIGTHRVINEALDGMGDKFRQAVVDDLHGIYRMERQLTGRTSPIGAYETARLTRGAGGLVDGAIRLGAPIRKANGSFDFQGKGLEKILEPVAGNLDEFLMYAVGRSSHELMLQGREKLFTPAEIQSMLQLKRPEFETAFNEYQTWNKGVLDFAESMGIINKKARGMWQRSQYLPFYRVGQAGASASRGGAQGNWAGIQALTGGTGNLRDILGNMTQNAAALIDTALKNEARANIVKLAETQRGGGNFLVKIAPDSKFVKIDREQVKDKLLESMGIDPLQVKRGNIDAGTVKLVQMVEQQLENAPGLFEFMVHNQTPKGNIMAVLEDGKPTYYEVADPLLYRAVSSLNRAPQHWIIRWLGMPKRIGQMTVTLTPDFMVANIARDTIMGSVMSRAGFRPFVDSAKGMVSRIKQDPTYREYLANGGGFASYLKDENTFRAHLDRFYTSKGINPKTVLDAPDKMLYFVETLADAFEMSTRLGEYKRLREQGAHPRHAAYVGRDISTDFAMKGDSQVLGALYDTVMFLRPAVVSIDRLYRGLAHDPNKGAIAAKAGTIALLSAWLYWHNKDNPQYADLDDWDKDTYWHFFIQVNGKEEHFRFPKIWEVGAISSLAERTVAKLIDHEPEYGAAVGRILKNLFNMNLVPQAIAPLYEQATNRNSFTNAPIETTGMENMQPFLRSKPNTSETMKAAGMATRDLPESMQVNPVRAEALLRGYFNTWAMYGLMLTDSALFSDKLPEKRLDELPVVRRFYEADPEKHTKYETMYYDMLGEARRLHGTMQELDQSGRSKIADEIEKAPLSSKAKQLERASRNIQTINADMEEARRSVLTPAEKRAKLDALTREKNDLLKATVLDVKG